MCFSSPFTVGLGKKSRFFSLPQGAHVVAAAALLLLFFFFGFAVKPVAYHSIPVSGVQWARFCGVTEQQQQEPLQLLLTAFTCLSVAA